MTRSRGPPGARSGRDARDRRSPYACRPVRVPAGCGRREASSASTGLQHREDRVEGVWIEASRDPDRRPGLAARSRWAWSMRLARRHPAQRAPARTPRLRTGSVDRVRAMDCPGRWDLTIASSQLLTPPVEVPGLQALPLAVSLDGQPAASLVGDRTPPELFLDGISRLPGSRRHGHLPENGLCLREMLPGPARWGSLHGYLVAGTCDYGVRAFDVVNAERDSIR